MTNQQYHGRVKIGRVFTIRDHLELRAANRRLERLTRYGFPLGLTKVTDRLDHWRERELS